MPAVLALSLALGSLFAIAGGGCGAPDPPPDLLLITVDTLRADRLGSYGSKRELTPNLDTLALESEVFEAMYAPASITVASISTMLTGLYPEQNSILSNESILSGSVATLASVLTDHGYRCGAVVSNWVLRSGGGLERGFAEYDASFPQLEGTRKVPERTAATTTNDALHMLDRMRGETPGPLFLWVHYQDPHGPYTPPENYRSWVAAHKADRASTHPTPPGDLRLPFGRSLSNVGIGSIPSYQRVGGHTDVAFYQTGYEAEIRYVDAEIGRLLDNMREAGFYRDAVVVFAADHGEALGEHDYWFAHGEYLHDPLVRIPVFIRVPGRVPARRQDVTGLVDLFPTLLREVGIPPPADLPGRDLLGEDAHLGSSTPYMATLAGSTVPRAGLVAQGLKYVVTSGDGMTPQEEIFRLGDDEEDIAAQAPHKLLSMRRALTALQASFRPEPERKRAFGVDDAKNLRALGYLDGP